MISFVLSSQALQPSMNFNIILPMGQFMPVILVTLVILSSHPSCPSNPIHPIHLSHPSNPSHSSYPSHLSNTSHPAVLFKSKLTLVILDSRKNRESRLDSWLLFLDSRFSIPERLIKPEQPLFKNDYKGFLFQVICSLLPILNCCENLQPSFKFWAIF